MSDPVDDADELRQWRELFRRLISGLSIQPCPDFCQDVAYVAFLLDSQRKHSPTQLRERLDDPVVRAELINLLGQWGDQKYGAVLDALAEYDSDASEGR